MQRSRPMMCTVGVDGSLVLSCLKILNVSNFGLQYEDIARSSRLITADFEEQYEWPRLLKFIISHQIYSYKSCEATGKNRYAIFR